MLADAQVTTPTQQQKKELSMKASHFMVLYCGDHTYYKWHVGSKSVRPFLERDIPEGADVGFVAAMEEADTWLADGTAFL